MTKGKSWIKKDGASFCRPSKEGQDRQEIDDWCHRRMEGPLDVCRVYWQINILIGRFSLKRRPLGSTSSRSLLSRDQQKKKDDEKSEDAKLGPASYLSLERLFCPWSLSYWFYWKRMKEEKKRPIGKRGKGKPVENRRALKACMQS